MNLISRRDSEVFVCLQGRLQQVDIEDIIYVEHSSRTIFIHTVKGVIYIPYTSLSRIQRILGDDYLHQCHKSYLVNRLHIERVDRVKNRIVLKNYMGKVALGRKYRDSFLKRLHYI